MFRFATSVRTFTYFPSSCLFHHSRSTKLMEWADDKNLTYSIRKLPSKREWGKDMPFQNKSSNLCQTGSNIPYTICILGRVSKLWFFDRGNPASQVSINIMPL